MYFRHQRDIQTTRPVGISVNRDRRDSTMTESGLAASAGSTPVRTPMSVGLLTCSFRRDFELCRLMCETVDRFVPQTIEHVIIVPSSDLRMFSGLRSSRRRVESVSAFEPRWFVHLPQPSERWRKALRLPRQEIILTPYSQPVRGWIAQQLRKLS